MRRRTFLQSHAAAGISPNRQTGPGSAWTQWGGPHRNFQTEASRPEGQWPATGPKVVWKRPLGEGYSSPAVENNVLYTMYGRPQGRGRVAGDAATGKTLWEHATPMTFRSDAPEHGQRSVLDAADRRRPAVHHGGRRPAAMPRQEDRQARFGPRSYGQDHRGTR